MRRTDGPGWWWVVAVLAPGCAHVAPPLPGTWHIVAAQETLGDLARRYHVPVEDLAELNALPEGNLVPGRELFIPEEARLADGARERALFGAPRGLRRGARTLHGDAGSRAGTIQLGVHLGWPVPARISSTFGWRDGRPHEGVDLQVPDGTPVQAAADGEVVYAGDRLRGYGNLVVLRHDEHLMTVYAHNEQLLVHEGQRVVRGQVLARSGHTGHATGPHVHFEVRVDGVAEDPLGYLEPP